jgi:DNA-directed RNA polymerase subunit RPC12/RpoP
MASVIRVSADQVLVVAVCPGCEKGINATCTRVEVGGPMVGACPLCGYRIEVAEKPAV